MSNLFRGFFARCEVGKVVLRSNKSSHVLFAFAAFKLGFLIRAQSGEFLGHLHESLLLDALLSDWFAPFTAPIEADGRPPRQVLTDALSRLANDPTVSEAEVNPLLVRADGVVAVDAVVRLA